MWSVREGRREEEARRMREERGEGGEGGDEGREEMKGGRR